MMETEQLETSEDSSGDRPHGDRAAVLEYPIPTLWDAGITSVEFWLALLMHVTGRTPDTLKFTALRVSEMVSVWRSQWYSRITRRFSQKHQRGVRRNCQWILEDALENLIPQVASLCMQAEAASYQSNQASTRRTGRILAVYSLVCGFGLGILWGYVFG